MDTRSRNWLRPAALWRGLRTGLLVGAGTLALGACSMDVENPTNVEDSDLYTTDAVSALVAGAAHDFAEATADDGGGGVYNAGAMLTDELVHVGTWVGLRGFSDGHSQDNWPIVQSHWGETSQARWVAEQGVERVSGILEENGEEPASSPAIAELHTWAGFSNRVLGDNFCRAVIDGGGYEDYTVYYDRAIAEFEAAVQVADAAGEDAFKTAATAGLAQVYMMQGDWDAAVAEANKIDTDFAFQQKHMENGNEDNMFRWWGYERSETSVWGTPFEAWGQNVDDDDSTGDPRVPWDIAYDDEGEVVAGGDNRRPFYRQLKYESYGDDISVAKGTEMRLIEAEAALVQDGDVGTVVSKVNEVRALHGLDPVDGSTVQTEEDAWELLQKERGLELWLEGRRLPDFRRWAKNQPGTVYTTVVREGKLDQAASADPRLSSLDTRVMERDEDMCIRVSENEKDSNPNL